MILQNSFEWNHWHGEFVPEHSSRKTQSISFAMEHWSVEHQVFAVETYFKNNDSVLTQRIFQEQGVRKETKDNGGFETEHQGKSGSNFSQHAATSDAELPETLGGMC
jgi:hypothetical protein